MIGFGSQYRHLDPGDELVDSLKAIGEHNFLLRRKSAQGTARQNKGDVGTMHAIGTRKSL
jgi:hypothetical protein